MTKCEVAGCRSRAKIRGMCMKHYKRTWRKEVRERGGLRNRKGGSVAEQRRRHVGRRQGWTDGLFEVYWDLQCGRCAICQVDLDMSAPGGKPRCHRDHDHETGLARGLLCVYCNMSLGHYEKHQRKVGLWLQPYEDYLRLSGGLTLPEPIYPQAKRRR